MINKIHNMDCIEGLKSLPDKSIDLIVTSPPYWKGFEYAEKIICSAEKGKNEYI